MIELKILFVEDNHETLLKELSGNFEEIVLPFYRVIKVFIAIKYDEKDWERIGRPRITGLNNLIQKYKYS